MPEVWTMGEILVEIMRPSPDMPLGLGARFVGPFPSGAPAIFIDTVARLGHSAGIVGGVAEDEFGDCLLERLRVDGVDVHRVKRSPRGATAVAFVAYASDGSRKYIFHINGTPAVDVDNQPFTDRETRFFHVMGCSLMANESLRSRIIDSVRQAEDLGAKISFDPNLRAELLDGRSLMEVIGPILERTSILLPGESELCLIGGADTPDVAASRLFAQHRLEVIVVKRGKKGASVLTRDGKIDIAPFFVEEVDPTGAGDCFDAGFLVGLLEGLGLEDACRIAAAAGALNAAAFGPMEGRLDRNAVNHVITGRAI